MSDVNTTDLLPPDPIEGDVEVGKGGKGFVLPPGEMLYTAVITEAPARDKTPEGYLKFELKGLHLVGGEHDGFEVRFTNITTKKWPNRKSNSILDFLVAHGFDVDGPSRPRTNEEYERLVAATVNRPFPVYTNWKARCKSCGTIKKGMRNFPALSTGGYQSRFNCPTCSTEDTVDVATGTLTPGVPVVVFANLQITSFGQRAAKGAR